MKKHISDGLAWLAFGALLLWLFSIGITFSGYWALYQQIATAVSEVFNCPVEHCSMQMNFEELPTHRVILGIDSEILESIKYPAFLVWLCIVFFQSFFVRSFRILPWRPLPQAPTPPVSDTVDSAPEDVGSG